MIEHLFPEIGLSLINIAGVAKTAAKMFEKHVART